MQPTALDGRDWLVLCIQSYVLRTPHHPVLVDSCVDNDKTRSISIWDMKTDNNYMDALAAARITSTGTLVWKRWSDGFRCDAVTD